MDTNDKRLFETADELSFHFRSKIRRYNTAFAFASLTGKLDTPQGRGPPVFLYLWSAIS